MLKKKTLELYSKNSKYNFEKIKFVIHSEN